uniref:ninjurin-2 isoform X3 n=1 Tax=Nyctereutes procyonoides TaxID=34880 RepID=UPI0024449127|nr:ninjurin-2 isoform X3 [Nyctereutes procyonoides]
MKSFSLVYIAVCIHMYVQTCIRESFKTSLPFWSLLGQPMFSLLQPGSPNLRRSQPITLNHYATKKSVAESMLDVAFFMSNAMRLKAVLEQGPSSHYYTTLVTLISISLLLQVVTGILLVVIAQLNLNEVEKQWQLNQLNNTATTLVFITVIVNVFITAFGAHKTGFLAARTSRNLL